MLFGRRVRGPLDVLREVWTDKRIGEVPVSVVDYIVAMRNRLQAMTELAQKNAKKAQHRQKAVYD